MGLKFRRGTTAQQSGSLAFGEPYVNTTLGTLVIGGATGDIVLSAGGTGSTGNFGAISGSGLDITGNANIGGNLNINGNFTIGNQTSDTLNVVASLSSSLIPQTTNVFDLGSADKIWRDLYISTGSIKIVNPGNNTVVGTLTSNANGDLNVAGALSSSTVTGIGNVTAYSSSVASRLDRLDSDMFNVTASVQALNRWTGSIATTASLNTLSSSIATTISSASSSAYSTFAKLNGGNTFTGNQIVSASVYVTGDMIVYGSSSLQNLTASAVSIGTNTVVLNTSTPAVRFGGIQVIDSGSSSATGSLFWDSQNDVWVYVNPTGSAYASARLLSGPKSLTLGSEATLTNTNVPKVDDGDHLVDSQITDDGTTVKVVNAISASTFTGLGNLTTYSSSVASRVNTLETAGYAVSSSVASATAASITSLSSSVKAVTDNFATSASVASATATSISTLSGSVKTVTDALSGRVTTLEAKDISITLTGDVTGTGTITDLGNVSFATTIAADSVALGTDTTGNYVGTITAGTGVSSTGATTGEGIAHTISIGQAVATSDNVRFNSLGIGMAASATAGRIDAAGDIVAFSSSDRNFKENITPIENPIEKIRKISGNTYDWKADLKDVHGYEGNDVGVIAQEIEEVLPQIVTTREMDTKLLNTKN
jgi:hypothetical protein